MRTSSPAAPSAAPAAPASAGQPATITPDQRRLIVLAKVEKLTISHPKKSLSVPQLLSLGADLAQLRRMARSKASLGTLLRICGRVAAAYGVDMATIDPCHGSAA